MRSRAVSLIRQAVVLARCGANPCGDQADKYRLTAREGSGNPARSRTWRRAARADPRSACPATEAGVRDAVRQHKCVQSIAAFGFTALLLLTSAAWAAPSPEDRSAPPNEDLFLNEPLPDIALTTAAGNRVSLSSLAGGRPLLFTFVFTRCTGVCSPFLASWHAADRSLSSSQSFHRLVLSFDPRDTAADMGMLAHHLGAEARSDWTFAIAAIEDVRRLAEATGFWYDWDPTRQQFDHPAMIVASRNGRLVRLLVGGLVSSGRLEYLVREAFGEFVPSYPLPGRVRFRCVQFDATTGRLILDWGFLLLLVPVAVCTMVTAGVFLSGARVRRVSDQQEHSTFTNST
jgi:cytochrome oxidase Cu insertion factor (SCO1/SenC/PrrC family)